jgi:DNA-binding IclR family transcriptional regulator
MAPKDTSSIITKSLAIVDILASSGRSMRYSEVLAASGFTKSSTHRLLSILQNEGVIEFDEHDKSYSLGKRLRGWARQSWVNNDLQRQSANELERLCESCGHNVCLMGMDGARTLVLSAIHPYQVPYAAKMGEYAAAHCTAGGKVLIAYMRKRPRDEVLDNLTFEQYAPNTITDRKVFEAQLEDVRRDGLAVTEAEEFMQTSAIAAPVYDHHGEVVAALCLWGVTERMKPRHVTDWADDLKAASRRISKNLGWVDH